MLLLRCRCTGFIGIGRIAIGIRGPDTIEVGRALSDRGVTERRDIRANRGDLRESSVDTSRTLDLEAGFIGCIIRPADIDLGR